MKLGIIGAMDVEVAALKAKMENINTAVHAGSAYFEGELEECPVVVVQCGVGKVNAALCAQILIPQGDGVGGEQGQDHAECQDHACKTFHENPHPLKEFVHGQHYTKCSACFAR